MFQNQMRHIAKGAIVIALMLLPVPATSITNAPSATPSLPPATAAMDLDAGAAAVKHRQYDLASRRLSRAIDSGVLSNEALALAYHHRGIARQKLGYDELAIKDYSKAMTLNALPKDVLARAYYNRGLANAKTGDTLSAELDYSHAIEIAPTYGAAYHNRANLERLRHDYPTAIRDYSVAIDNLSTNDRVLPLMGRALSYEKTGNVTAANSDLDKIFKLDANYKPALQLHRQLASLSVGPIAAQTQTNDQIETGSLASNQNSVAPRHGEVISQSAQNGWDTRTVRYANTSPVVAQKTAAADLSSTDDDNIITGSLRPIDMVAAPGQKLPATTPLQVAEINSKTPVLPLTTNSQYRIQLGAFRQPEIAAQAWANIARTHPTLTTAMQHAIEKADLGTRGIYYRLQAGNFETANAAKSQCIDFITHKVDCIVVSR